MGCGLCTMEKCRGVGGARVKLRRLLLCRGETEPAASPQKMEIGEMEDSVGSGEGGGGGKRPGPG